MKNRVTGSPIPTFRHFAAMTFLLSSLFVQARETPKLNSERIEATFGNYGIRILEREPRVSVLFSKHDGVEICRTMAIVEFATPIPTPLKAPVAQVKAGASLGATLKESGWRISKRFLHYDTLPAGSRFIRLAHLSQTLPVAVSIYELVASRDEDSFRVATLVEVYHPDYLTLADLKSIQPAKTEAGPRVKGLLQLARKKMNDEKD